MAFMLGAFTGDLFGGAHSAMQLVNDWNILKNQRDMREAAGAVKGALDTAPQDNGVLPTVTDRAALPDAGTTGSGYNANGQPDIESMPLPNFMKPPLSAPPKAKLAGGASHSSAGAAKACPPPHPARRSSARGAKVCPSPRLRKACLAKVMTPSWGALERLATISPRPGAERLTQSSRICRRAGPAGWHLCANPAARGCCARSALRLCANPATCAACAANRVCRVAGMPGTPSGPAVQPPVQPATASALPAEPPSAITELGQSILRALAGGGAPGF